MNQNHLDLAEQIALYVQGKLSDEGVNILLNRADKEPEIAALIKRFQNPSHLKEEINILREFPPQGDFAQVLNKFNDNKRKRKHFYYSAAAYLSAAILLIVALWHNFSKPENHQIIPDHTYGQLNDISPGENQAILTLENGKSIPLNKDSRLDIAGLEIQNQQLQYQGSSSDSSVIHSLYVPVRGTYKLKLSDNSIVWINADSKISYPKTFSGKKRIVHLTGEAYFEVAPNADQPFIVITDKLSVQALGTAFNINTHKLKGKTKTILTEGSVKVSNAQESKILTPGLEAISNGSTLMVQQANIEEALAWKDGYFNFEDNNLDEILDEVSRWYAVKVIKKTTFKPSNFVGGIKRTESLASVCAVLSDLSDYSFQIEGTTLIVNAKKGGPMN